MQLALPQINTQEAYHRLATVYTFVFGIAAASFYLTLLQNGSDLNLALFAAVAAGLHYGLLRLAGAGGATVSHERAHYVPASPLANADLIVLLGQLQHETRSTHEEFGLMLIELGVCQDKSQAPSPEALKLVRGELFRAADSRIFQVDEQTLAVAEAQDDVVLHFDKIAVELQKQLRAAQPRFAESAPYATIGVAVASGGLGNARELVDNARSAIRLAEANHRDTYFRRIS